MATCLTLLLTTCPPTAALHEHHPLFFFPAQSGMGTQSPCAVNTLLIKFVPNTIGKQGAGGSMVH